MRTKKGRRPIAPPRLVCTLESPVSLRINTGQLGIQPGPASSVPVISPFRNAFRRTLASALAPDVIGPRSHGRRAQTARSLRCSLDSPPSDGRWFVATVPLLTHLVPVEPAFTHPSRSHPQAAHFCRQTAFLDKKRPGRETRGEMLRRDCPFVTSTRRRRGPSWQPRRSRRRWPRRYRRSRRGPCGRARRRRA